MPATRSRTLSTSRMVEPRRTTARVSCSADTRAVPCVLRCLRLTATRARTGDPSLQRSTTIRGVATSREAITTAAAAIARCLTSIGLLHVHDLQHGPQPEVAPPDLARRRAAHDASHPDPRSRCGAAPARGLPRCGATPHLDAIPEPSLQASSLTAGARSDRSCCRRRPGSRAAPSRTRRRSRCPRAGSCRPDAGSRTRTRRLRRTSPSTRT
jgi:hypothetical protein